MDGSLALDGQSKLLRVSALEVLDFYDHLRI